MAIGYDFGGEMTSVDTYMAASADDADSGNQVMSEALSYNGDSQATDIGFTSATTGDMLAGYHYAYNNDQAVTDLYSYSDTNTSVSTPNPSEPTTTWAHAGYSYDHQQQLTATSYTYWANPPTTDGSLAYDANGNRDNTGETVSPGNQVTYDGTYYYLYDAEGNRTFKFKSTSGALDDTATDITKYTWDYRNRMTSISYYATWSHYTSNTPDTKAVYEYDAYDRQVDEDQTAGGSLDERFIWDGSSLLMTLDGSNHVSQRYLNGPAVDQVFAEEYEGGSNPGVNWLLADGQGSVRDVVRATVSDGSVVSVEAVDHVFLDAYGLQYSPQSNSDAQEQTSVGFTGLRYDTLSGFYMSATRRVRPGHGHLDPARPARSRPRRKPLRILRQQSDEFHRPEWNGRLRLFDAIHRHQLWRDRSAPVPHLFARPNRQRHHILRPVARARGRRFVVLLRGLRYIPRRHCRCHKRVYSRDGRRPSHARAILPWRPDLGRHSRGRAIGPDGILDRVRRQHGREPLFRCRNARGDRARLHTDRGDSG